MGDMALLGWGIMIGCWITSLWIMHRHRGPSTSVAERMLLDMAAKIEDRRRFAPDCVVTCEQPTNIAGRHYQVSVTPLAAPSDPS